MGMKIPFLHQLQLNYGSVVSYYRPADTLWCPLCISPLPQHRVGGTLRWTMGPSSRHVTRRSTPTLLTAPGWSLSLLASASKSTSPCFRCTGLTTSSPSGKTQRFLLAELFWSVNIKCATVSIRWILDAVQDWIIDARQETMGVFLLIRISAIKATEMGRNMAVDSRTWILLVPCGQGTGLPFTHIFQILCWIWITGFLLVLSSLYWNGIQVSWMYVIVPKRERTKISYIYKYLCACIYFHPWPRIKE